MKPKKFPKEVNPAFLVEILNRAKWGEYELREPWHKVIERLDAIDKAGWFWSGEKACGLIGCAHSWPRDQRGVYIENRCFDAPSCSDPHATVWENEKTGAKLFLAQPLRADFFVLPSLPPEGKVPKWAEMPNARPVRRISPRDAFVEFAAEHGLTLRFDDEWNFRNPETRIAIVLEKAHQSD